jgi:hypothetical protein
VTAPHAPHPAIDIRYAKPAGVTAQPTEAPVVQVRFARRDIEPPPPAVDTPDTARPPAMFAVISAGGDRQPLAAAVVPPI